MFRTRSNYGIARREIRDFPKLLPTYGLEVDKETGRKVAVKTGTTNQYQQIQESVPETLIYNLIDRVNRTGDMSLLGKAVEGMFDATVLPNDLLEAQCVRVKAEQIFAQLPYEERLKYGNDVYKFIGKVNETLRANVQKKKAAKRAEVVENTPPAAEGDK